MKPTEQQIEDCRVRGIVPGAEVQCAGIVSTSVGFVLPYDQWTYGAGKDVICGYDQNRLVIYACTREGDFATVLTPASKPALTPGMACLIPSAAGRQFVKELAEAKGLWCNSKFDREMDSLGEKAHTIAMYKAPDISANTVGLLLGDYSRYCYVPLHEFIRLLMEYEPSAPPKTTEERLKEAVDVMHIAELGLKTAVQKEKSCQMIGTITPKWALENVEAFLESIKP